MRYPSKFWALGVALVMWLTTSTVLAAPSPKQVIQDGSDKIKQVLKKKTAKGSKARGLQKADLRTAVEGFLDYKELGRRALGPHWKDRSPEEQEDFYQLLRDLIESSYEGAIHSNADFELKIEDEEIDEEQAKASIMAVASGKDAKGKTVAEDLTFHLFLKNRKWMIYDVEFGDVSLVRHYRGEFNRKIKKESYAALIATMKKKLAEVGDGKAEGKIKL